MTKLRKGVLTGAAVLLAASVTLLACTWGARYGREREGAYWEMRMEQKNAELSALQAENDTLRSAAASAGAESDPARQALLDDLMKQQALIPVSPELGGTMRFFPALSRLLGDRYAYAYAEDGHVAVDMVFRYRQNEDASIDWRLVMLDTGNGWEAAPS